MTNDKYNAAVNKPLSISDNRFPVVGIGASAGGLEAFKKLLKAIPENSGMAYVLVQHLDPKHESLLPELLQKVTTLPVLEITDDIKVEPDHIYILPSNKMMIANDGVLLLSPRPEKSKTERNLPIDVFFTSLAEVHQSHAIGVVLSGTASDGTNGLRAIKNQGGITFAQDEESAAYEGMPQSAARAGVVDFILPPDQIPQKLVEITRKVILSDDELQNIPQDDATIFKQILVLLRLRKGTDFTYYKQTTIRRRIFRRIALNKSDSPARYLDYLRENKPEQDLLYQDLLIPVTNFFRDNKTFDHLCETVFPQIVKYKTSGEPVRIWVAACSTGEEVYSIAICFKELLGDNQRMQIFATDISEPAIIKARAAIYTRADVNGITELRLQEFFTRTGDSYQVNKSIRDMCVFAVHNFLKDPPFGKMDFISCRNVLIYMEPYLQKKALTTFHYALNEKGLLLLGKSETASAVTDLFSSATKKEKLFVRRDVPGRFMQNTTQGIEQSFAEVNMKSKNAPVSTDFQKTADEILLGKYTPAGVVVNEAMDIVHFRGSTGNYLEAAPGKASLNLLKMAKNGLGFELRNILHKAKKDNTTVVKENIPLQVNGSLHNITIEAMPLPNVLEPHFLILFQDGAVPARQLTPGNKKTTSKAKNDDKDLRIQQLEKELAQLREDVRSITEDQEAVNEELQSANEELLSGSEELQSLNEEMETSKEELQSTNEELTVVNQEIIGLNEQVSDARDYAEAIVTTVWEPLVVLDKNLRVKSANTAFYKTFQASEMDTVGRLMYELGGKQWNIPALRTLLEEILPRKTRFADFEVKQNFPNIGERVMRLNARELSRDKTDEKLILVAIEDVTEKVTYRQKIEESEAFNRSVLESSPDCIKILDAEGRLHFINSNGTCMMELVDFSNHQNIYWWDLWEEKDHQTIKDAFFKALSGEKEQFQASRKTTKGTLKWFDIIVLPLEVNVHTKKAQRILSVSRDITEIKQGQLKEKVLLERFQSLVLQAPVAICVMRGKDYVIEVINRGMYEMWDKTLEQTLNKPAFEVLPELMEQGFKELLETVYTTGKRIVVDELPIIIKRNGKRENVFVKFVYEPMREADGTVSGVMALAHEITDLVTARKEKEAQALMVENLLMTAPAFVCTLSGPDHVYELVNERYQQLFGKRKIQGNPLMKALPELKGQGFAELLDKVYNTGEIYVGIDVPITLARDVNLAPELRYFNFSYQPMFDMDKNINSVLAFGYETTAEVISKNNNLKNEQLRAKELEEKINERTVQLMEANQKLLFESQEKEKRAKELDIAIKELSFQNEEKEKQAGELMIANNELKQFTYISSHDLQEPLRKIQTFAAVILEKEVAVLSSQGKDYFKRLHSAANRMQTLIQDLLAFSHSGTSQEKFENTDLQKMLGEVISDLSETILKKNASIKNEASGEAFINPLQFRQVFINLLTNALKFSKPGRLPVILINSHMANGLQLQNENALLVPGALSPQKKYCHIGIADNGIGLDPKYKDKIFEVFQRLHGKEEYEGTGIGLAIVKKIIDNHHGAITATGRLGVGTTFDIYIPEPS